MIHIVRTNSEGKPYYEGDSIVWIMVAHILHIRKCADRDDLITEVVTMATDGYTQNYYTTTPFKQIQDDVNHILKHGSVRCN